MKNDIKTRLKKMEAQQVRPVTNHKTLADMYTPKEIAIASAFLYGEPDLKKLKADEK